MCLCTSLKENRFTCKISVYWCYMVSEFRFLKEKKMKKKKMDYVVHTCTCISHLV